MGVGEVLAVVFPWGVGEGMAYAKIPRFPKPSLLHGRDRSQGPGAGDLGEGVRVRKWQKQRQGGPAARRLRAAIQDRKCLH